MKVIRLKYPSTCSDCGAALPIGSKAKWYGRGMVYGLDCHDTVVFTDGEEPGLTLSRYDRYGVYLGDGTRIGSTCGCEDYPCCGH